MAEVKGAAKKFLVKSANIETGVCKFVLANGLEVQFDVTKAPEEIQKQLMLHGALQKIGDSVAGLSKEGKYSEAFGTMQGVVDNLYQGIFNARGGAGTSDLAEALAELKGVSLEDAQEAIGKMDEEQLKGVQSHPQVKAKILAIKAARAAKVAAAGEELDLEVPGL